MLIRSMYSRFCRVCGRACGMEHALFHSLPNSFAIFCNHHTDMCREDDAALPTSSAFSAKH
jgi:hypothetical protein